MSHDSDSDSDSNSDYEEEEDCKSKCHHRRHRNRSDVPEVVGRTKSSFVSSTAYPNLVASASAAPHHHRVTAFTALPYVQRSRGHNGRSQKKEKEEEADEEMPVVEPIGKAIGDFFERCRRYTEEAFVKLARSVEAFEFVINSQNAVILKYLDGTRDEILVVGAFDDVSKLPDGVLRKKIHKIVAGSDSKNASAQKK